MSRKRHKRRLPPGNARGPRALRLPPRTLTAEQILDHTSLNGDAASAVKPPPVPRPTVPAAPPVERSRPASTPSPDDGLSRMQRAFLTVLAQHPDGLTKQQMLILAGYASSGPTSRCFAQLIRDEWAVSPVPNRLQITPAGREVLGAFEPLPKGAALRERRLNDQQLKPVDRAILKVLFDRWPDDVGKGEILEQAGYASSGPTSRSFAKLVRLGWAVKTFGAGQSRLAASNLFFEE
jgi:hypothetical protein